MDDDEEDIVDESLPAIGEDDLRAVSKDIAMRISPSAFSELDADPLDPG